ncbi:MAG: cytochrome c maturation protein CcmE [Chloroflexi bacterium]|nr:cytochrome c maturation protein CcmE [Chloroflexota bacterium]
MAEIQWEKDKILPAQRQAVKRSGRWKFLVVGVVMLAAIGYLLYSSSLIGARYYVTVEDLINDPEMLNKTARVSGAVDGDPIYDPATQELRFVIANIPNDNDSIREQGGLALVLHKAVSDPSTTRVQVIVHDKEIPDLLKNEAQAIMSGKLKLVDGEYIFYADEITLKCPTKYEEDVPEQVVQ